MKFTKRGWLWGIGGFTIFAIILFSVLYTVNEESWDERGSGNISQVIAGDLVEIQSGGRAIRIKLAFVDAPTPQSVHGQEAIQHIKKQGKTFQHANYRVKKIGNQYIGEVKMDDFGWDLSLNHQLISHGFARVDVREKGEWKKITIDSYIKSQELTKNMQRGIWAYHGYVTNNGFDLQIEKQIAMKKKMAVQKEANTKQRNREEQEKQSQELIQSIQKVLQEIKQSNPNIAFTKYKEDPSERDKQGYILWIDVYVKEYHWANMTTSQKLSMVATTNQKIEDAMKSLFPNQQRSPTVVQFYSDTAKDLLAEEKTFRLSGSKWKILR